jgi:adenine-specific DNA-methyltransferase
MMYPRLVLANRILSDTGAIFVSVDDNELHNLISLMSEIFGSERYIATISAVTNMKGRNDKLHIATAHEYIVVFAGPKFLSRGFPLTAEQRAVFDQIDDLGRAFSYRDMRKRGGPDRREDRPKMYFPIYWDEKTGRCSLTRMAADNVEVLPKRGDGSEGRWRWGSDTVAANLPWLRAKRSAKTGRLDVDHRVYLDPTVRLGSEASEEIDDEDEVIERSSKPKSVWIGGSLSTDSGNRSAKDLLGGSVFDFPKSVDLIKNVIVMSTSGDDLVLDFFAGSGTTGHAVMAQNAADGANRRYALVQLPEQLSVTNKDQKVAAEFCDGIEKPRNLAELTKERLRRAAQKIRDDFPDTKLDLGFRVYKLATSNLRGWEPGDDLAADLLAASDNIVPGRTEGDLLTELLLKQGIDLTEPMVTETIAGAPVHAMGGGVLVVCLAPVTAAGSEALADGISDWIERLNPVSAATIFFKDAGFENDVAKANVAAILDQRLEDKLLKVRSL